MGRRMWFWWGAGEGGKLDLFPFLASVHIHLLGPQLPRGARPRERVRLEGALARSGPACEWAGRPLASSAGAAVCVRVTGVWSCGFGRRAGKMSWAMKTTAVEKGRALGVRRGTRSY